MKEYLTDKHRITCANTGFASGGLKCKLGALSFYENLVIN